MPNKKQSPKIEPSSGHINYLKNISKCCEAGMAVHSNDDGTSFYFCTKCFKACDAYIAPKKRVKKEKPVDSCIPNCAGCAYEATASTSRPCPEGKFYYSVPDGATSVENGKYILTKSTPNGWNDSIPKSDDVLSWNCPCKVTPSWLIWLRRIMLVVLGGLLVLAYFKFFFIVHVSDLGDLILLRR